MFKDFILLLLVITISTKTVPFSSTIEFDIDQSFDSDNHEFTFTNEALEQKFFLVEIQTDSLLGYEYQCQGSEKKSGKTHTEPVFIIKANTGECNINITSSSWVHELKGTINIHPFDREIAVDFEKYRYRIESITKFDEEFPPLLFSVSNLAKDTEVLFTYIKSNVIINEYSFVMKNPYQIYDGNETIGDIEEFKFIKGKDYKIKIIPEELVAGTKKYYYMNQFDFYSKDGGNKNLKANIILVDLWIYLMLSLLLL